MNKDYIETLKEERIKCKKKLKTFIILSAIALSILFIAYFGLIFTLISFGIEGNQNQLPQNAVGIILLIYFIIITTGISLNIFIPFIIVNAVKLGKRNSVIKRYEMEINNG